MLFTSKDGLTTKDFSTDSVAFGNRILSIEHNEKPYNEDAEVILKDYDSTIPSMLGYWTEIGYGDTTSAGNEYLGSQTSRLYVKHQRHVTASGKLHTVLELDGLWTRLEQALVRIGSAPLWQTLYDGTTDTIYKILKDVFTNAGLSLPVALPVGADDSIINTLKPYFEINSDAGKYETARYVIYRLIQLTKCYLRPPSASGTEFGVVYPEDTDVADLTFYSHSSPYFYQFMERMPALIPNHFEVYGNAVSDTDWTGYKTSESPNGVSQTDIDALYEVYAHILAPNYTLQADINAQAAVQLVRARAENGSGFALIPHDCRVQLYDKLAFVDTRGGGTPYPSNAMTRVSSLVHRYQPGKYQLEVHLGGVSNRSLTPDVILQGYRFNPDYDPEDPKSKKQFKTGGGLTGNDSMTTETQEAMKALAEIKAQINTFMAQKKAALIENFMQPGKSPLIPQSPSTDYWDVDMPMPGESDITEEQAGLNALADSLKELETKPGEIIDPMKKYWDI